jgi:hypothetical protein
MQVKRRVLLLAALPLIAAAVALLLPAGARAEQSYVEATLANTSARLDYVIPPGVAAIVTQDEAVGTARRYANAPPNAVARSVRLALYSDLADHGVLVWVVDLDGISRAAHQQVMASPVPPRIITREVWMISATEPGKAFASFASLPAIK